MKKSYNKVYHVEVTITNQCNCNCKYCFEANHDYNSSKDEEKLQLSKIIELCEDIKKENSSLILSFWGGEPMMNIDFLFVLIEKTYKYGFITYNMFTNGLLLDNFKKMVSQSWFENIKNRFNIQISYDGEPHNVLERGYNKEKILKTFDYLVNNDIKPSLKATLSLKNLKLLPQIWISYYEIFKKYNHISYSPTLDTTDNNISYLNDWENSLQEIITYELNFLKKYQRPLWFWFKESEKINCLNSNRLHIHNDGNIYLCHGCPYLENNNKFVIGNTKQGKLSDLFIDYETDEINMTCKMCDALYCSVCHINNISDNVNNIDGVNNNWIKCRHLNENKCKYYRIFAKYSRILKTAFIKGKYG